MSWLKLFRTLTKPSRRAAAKRSAPFTKEDWDAFAIPYRETAKAYLKQARAWQRKKEGKVTADDLNAAIAMHREAEAWQARFQRELDQFDFLAPGVTDAMFNRSTVLEDKVAEAEGELYDAVSHLQFCIELQTDAD